MKRSRAAAALRAMLWTEWSEFSIRLVIVKQIFYC